MQQDGWGGSLHEMSLMAGVFEIVEQTLAQHEIKRILKLKLRVGKLTNAQPDALCLAFEAYAQGTKAEGAELVIEEVPVRARCHRCGKEFPVTGFLFLCPHCQNVGLEILQGEELLVESLEVE